MKFRTILLTMATVAVLVAPLMASAQTGAGGGPGSGYGSRGQGFGAPGHGGNGLGFFDRALPRLAERLELSDQQMETIQGIVEEARPQMESYAEQLQAGREAWRESNDDPTVFDEGAFRSHVDQQHQIKTELMVLTQQTKAKALAVLTPEQLQQFEQMHEQFGQRFKRGSGHRRGSH
jgi:Spy/CpxP family protein refolding chaperone